MSKTTFASLVVFKNDKDDLHRLIESFRVNEPQIDIYVGDNSPNNTLEEVFTSYNRVTYFHIKENLGFGRAHNFLAAQANENYEYQIIVNPDVYFEEPFLNQIIDFSKKIKDARIVMPKVLYPSGELQYLCKELPTPIDLIGRRFLSDSFLAERILKYEMRLKDYSDYFAAPTVSGCFMFMRADLYQSIGGFDERFFMYLEDVDLCKRAAEGGHNYYFPECTVYHKYAKGSYQSKKLLWIHIKSAVAYFNKHSWFPFW